MGLVLLVVLNRVAGLLASALLVVAAWTHGISAIQPWLLSTIMVGAAVILFVLCLVFPTLVKGFLVTTPLGFGAAALIAAATQQWFAALAMAFGVVLARSVLAAASAVQRETARGSAS